MVGTAGPAVVPYERRYTRMHLPPDCMPNVSAFALFVRDGSLRPYEKKVAHFFSQGQLYVAMSRVDRPDAFVVYVPPEDRVDGNMHSQNTVYPEASKTKCHDCVCHKFTLST